MVNRELACLKNIFSKVVQWRITTNNPTKIVTLLRAKNKMVRFLEKEEIEKLLKACPDYLKLIVTVAVLTGMRKAEILNLRWKT